MNLRQAIKRNESILWTVGLSLLLAILILLACGIIYFLLKSITWILVILFWSILLSFFLNPVGNFLAKFLPKIVSSILTILICLAFLALIVYLIVPPLVHELTVLSDNLPSILTQLQDLLAHFDRFLASLGLNVSLVQTLQELSSNIQSWIGGILSGLYSFGVSLVNFIVGAFLVFLITVFLLRDWSKLRPYIVNLVPAWRKGKGEELLSALATTISRYLGALFLSAGIVGILIGIGAYFFKIPYYWILGLVAFIAEFVPYIGPFFSLIFGLLLTLGKPWVFLLYIAAYYLAVQALQNYVISPLIMSRRMGFHPLIVILAILVGGALFGFWGIILAVPVLSIVRTLYQFIRKGNQVIPPTSQNGE